MTGADLAGYRTVDRAPTRVDYRGHQVIGMGPPSSGGSTVGEALNLLEGFDLASDTRAQALFHFLEASRIAFADRNRWVGDPAYVEVPLRGLLSQGFADERRCLIGERANVSRTLPEAIAAPRVSQRNSDPGDAEPAFLASPEAAELQALGELFRVAPTPAPLPPEIGAATGIAFLGGGVLQAAAEPVRRGGGSALVVHPLE